MYKKAMWMLSEPDLDYPRNDMAGSFSIDDQYTAKNPKACVRYLTRQYGTRSLHPPPVWRAFSIRKQCTVGLLHKRCVERSTEGCVEGIRTLMCGG